MDRPKLPTYFLSHGGGPWPWLTDERPIFRTLEKSLKDVPFQLGREPDAILMISGHWEEKSFAVTGNPHPPMVYDYQGFPEHTYRVKYPAPGSPELAHRVQNLIQAAGFPTQWDNERGFDHGAFTPIYPMYPDAHIPMVQLSLRKGYDPGEHFDVGRALAPLRTEGVLIVGSGLSYHNLRSIGSGDPLAGQASKEFDNWLQGTLLHSSPRERRESLLNWSGAPSARLAHPREDHLIPLMVAAGAAENEPAFLVYHEEVFFGNLTASSFRFGSDLRKQT